MPMKHPRWLVALSLCAILAAAAALAGCAADKDINCQVVRLQREAGRSEEEIAATFAASIGEVQKCEQQNSSPTGAPAEEPSPAPDQGSASPY